MQDGCELIHQSKIISLSHYLRRDEGNRAVKTFIQVAVGYLLAALANVDIFNSANGKTFWAGLLVSTVAAGASATWNGVVKPVLGTVKDGWKG